MAKGLPKIHTFLRYHETTHLMKARCRLPGYEVKTPQKASCKGKLLRVRDKANIMLAPHSSFPPGQLPRHMSQAKSLGPENPFQNKRKPKS